MKLTKTSVAIIALVAFDFLTPNFGFISLAEAQSASPYYGGNLLTNPWMELDQVNEGASTTLTASAAGTYTYRSQGDGWGATAATTASGLTTAFQNASIQPNGSISDLLVTVGTGSATHADGTILDVEQRIEPSRIAALAYGTTNAQPATLQFCMKGSVAGTYSFALIGGTSARVADLATTGSSYFQTFSYPTAAQASCYSFSIPGNTGGTWLATTTTVDATHGMTLVFPLGLNGVTTNKFSDSTVCGAGGAWRNGVQNCLGLSNATSGNNVTLDKTTGATFELTGVKLSLDNAPLAHSPELELMTAQRYYAKTFTAGTGGNSGVKPAQALGVAAAKGYASGGYMQVINVATGIYWPFPVQMRAAPTITTFSPQASTSACADITTNAAGGAATVESGITGNATSVTGVSISCAAATESLGDRVGVGITADARL